MSEIRDHVAYLSQNIGPRPAGTEEEQQAALYITERLQQEAGLSTAIEDFNCNPDCDIPKALCAGLAVLVAIIAMIVPLMAIPAFIVTLVMALLFAAETFDRPVISRFFNKGVSQNVVAKYEPAVEGTSRGARRRKIVLVAHYDTGKVRKELSGPLFGLLPILKWMALGGMAALPVLFLLRCLVSFGGVGLIVINVITGVALVCAALTLFALVLNRTAAYNEGANCNAAGVAVLMDVAARINHAGGSAAMASRAGADGASCGDGFAADADDALGEEIAGAEAAEFEPVMHGEAAVLASGLIPEGAELDYDAPAASGVEADLMADADAIVNAIDESEESPAARLAAAKAAVAALTGKPVSSTIHIDFPEEPSSASAAELPQEADGMGGFDVLGEAAGVVADVVGDAAGAAVGAAGTAAAVGVVDAVAGEAAGVAAVAGIAGAAGAVAGEVADVATDAVSAPKAVEQDKSVPDWFARAQQKAKKPAEDAAPVQRSRYADALDAAIRESGAHFQEANDATASEMEQRLQQMRNNIMEVRAPGFDRDARMSASARESADEVLKGKDAMEADAAKAAKVAEVAEVAASALVIDGAPKDASVASASAAVAAAAKSKVPVSVAGATGELPIMPASTSAQAPVQAPAKPRVRSLQGVNIPSVIGGADAAQSAAQPAADVAASAEGAASGAAARPAPRRRRAMALPNIGKGQTGALAPVSAPESEDGVAAEKPAGRLAGLRSMLPSTGATGAIAPIAAPAADEQVAEGAADELQLADDAFVAEQGVVEQPMADPHAQDDQGWDDYAAEADEFEDVPAPEAPEYVEMPKSRMGGFFGRFRLGRKKKEERQSSAQEWLGVDEEFDARSAGAARGSWESFRQDDFDGGYDDYDDYGDYDEFDGGATTQFTPVDAYEEPSRRRWNGGGFSRSRLGRVSVLSGAEDDQPAADAPFDDAADYAYADDYGFEGAAGDYAYEAAEDYAADYADEYASDYDSPYGAMPVPELEDIYEFRNPAITTEVWFVALGSELANNGGSKAFLAEHAADLKGAIIIELEALGAGELSVIGKEGSLRPRETSSRMKRYAKKAASAFGAHLAEGSICWKTGAAAYALQRGHQAMHVAGMLDGKPAFCAQANDMLENVEEETLLANSDFVMELVRQI